MYIIESPSASDVYHKRYEGDMLQKALSLDLIYSAHRIVVNSEAFKASLLVGLEEQVKTYANLLPIVHISAHGGADGIELTSGEIIGWEELKALLTPINKALNGSLFLCMSSCEGFSACRMAMNKDDELPFFAVIGNKGRPVWSDTAIAYASFYHLISKGCYVVDAVKAMCEASGDTGFTAITGAEAKKAFVDVIEHQKIEAIRENLEEEINKNPPSQEATNLEKAK